MQRCSAAMSPAPTRPTTDTSAAPSETPTLTSTRATTDTSAAPSETPTLDVVVTVLPADGADQVGLGEQVLTHSPCALADLPDSHMRAEKVSIAAR
jgi:hypothetical protein